MAVRASNVEFPLCRYLDYLGNVNEGFPLRALAVCFAERRSSDLTDDARPAP